MSRWIVRLFVLALVVCCAVARREAPGTVRAETESEPATPATAPAVDGAANATATSSAADMNDDMRNILKKVGSIPCSSDIRARMYALLYENNRELHDRCYSDCGYQFFPLSKDRATTTQIVAAASSKACVTLFSGVILANFPECDVDMVSTRSCAEILLRIKKDIDDKRLPPTQKQFFEFYNLNRVVNLLNENASLIEDAFRNSSARISLWEMTKMMNRIYISPDIKLEDDMTIYVREEAKPTTKPGASTTKPADRAWKEANTAFSAREGDSSTSSGSSSATSSSSGSSSSSSGSNAGPTPTPTPTETQTESPPTVKETTKASSAVLPLPDVFAVAVAITTSCCTLMRL